MTGRFLLTYTHPHTNKNERTTKSHIQASKEREKKIQNKKVFVTITTKASDVMLGIFIRSSPTEFYKSKPNQATTTKMRVYMQKKIKIKNFA